MNERDMFHAAVEIADPGERSAYLEKVCAGDASLKRPPDFDALRGREDFQRLVAEVEKKASQLLELKKN